MEHPRASLPSAPDEVMPGDVIAEKYRFERLLGEGAQGWVWQAQNLALDVPVAIKIVRSEHMDKSVPERLFREARAAARLGHPAIVRIFDLGQAWDGLPFLVMELLEGENLADRLVQSGRLSPELTLRLLLPIADALIAAHAKGIVHRDVKPDNVFLALNGDSLQPKLLDFGIAKVTPHPTLPRQLTQSGAIVGSPAYLSPEQAQALGVIDERADVWSFSTTIYECITGQVPFEAESWRDLKQQIVAGEARSILECGVGDEALWEILKRGLAKDPQRRWPTMLDLGRALARWLVERGVHEDVCGVSIESRWLRTEPHGAQLFAAIPAPAPQTAALRQSSGPARAEVAKDPPVARVTPQALPVARRAKTSAGPRASAVRLSKRGPKATATRPQTRAVRQSRWQRGMGIAASLLVLLLAGAWRLSGNAEPAAPEVARQLEVAPAAPLATHVSSALTTSAAVATTQASATDVGASSAAVEPGPALEIVETPPLTFDFAKVERARVSGAHTVGRAVRQRAQTAEKPGPREQNDEPSEAAARPSRTLPTDLMNPY